MSHIIKFPMTIRDLAALAAACKRIGLEFVSGQTRHRAYTTRRCAHAIRVPGDSAAYEIGVTKERDGSYRLQFDADMYDSKAVLAKAGRGLSTLRREYQAEVATRRLVRQGYSVTRTYTKDRIIIQGRTTR